MAVQIEVKDLGWNRIVKESKKLNNKSTVIGLFGNKGGAGENLAERGAVHEYGTRSGKVPSRPWMRKTFKEKQRPLMKEINNWYTRILSGRATAQLLLKNIGAWYEGQLKRTIVRGGFLPLKAATIKAKGSSKPLIDTGNMLSSISHESRRG